MSIKNIIIRFHAADSPRPKVKGKSSERRYNLEGFSFSVLGISLNMEKKTL